MSSALTCEYLRELPLLDRPRTGALNIGPVLAPPDTVLAPGRAVDDMSVAQHDCMARRTRE